MKRITCLLSYTHEANFAENVAMWQKLPEIDKIVLWKRNECLPNLPGVDAVCVGSMGTTAFWQAVKPYVSTPYLLCVTSMGRVEPGIQALERMIDSLDEADAPMLYTDYRKRQSDGIEIPMTLNDAERAFLRDDYDFGCMQLYRSDWWFDVLNNEMPCGLHYSAHYSMLLSLSLKGMFLHLPEFLYTVDESEMTTKAASLFDYVDPSNRDRQIEMENCFTDYLKKIGAYLPARQTTFAFSENDCFSVEASVIIPVKNRVQTIADAIRSVLCQCTNFPFNLIVVDNHSTDGTKEAVSEFLTDRRVVLLEPDRCDLGIGGCWNWAVSSVHCGRFAVQLDSDDVYVDANVLQKIIDTFYKLQVPMVVGSYRMTDFDLHEIPPGVIAHREWSDANGHNNLLRVHGIGAPRAFYTPVLRKHPFPNVSYGEDYAVALRISRDYRIGRIYDVLYCCRRWSRNSDAMLTHEQSNLHHRYKDRLRNLELKARIKRNKSRE